MTAVEKSVQDQTVTADIDAFDWRNCWYPVSFVRDLAKDRPFSFTLYDVPLVLFYDDNGTLSCLRDKCPHRAARLSDGQLVNGRLECGYHGWQFNVDGQCVHIPQLPSDGKIPEKACVRVYPAAEFQGIIWIWAGESERADRSLIPVTPVLDDPEVTSVDFQMDLPYDQSYLIENVIDVAHIHIAHHDVRGGGHRDDAGPIYFNIVEKSGKGILSQLSSSESGVNPETSVLQRATVEYLAPNLIQYASEYRNTELISGLDLFSLPLGKSRCRLLYRKYSNFTSWKESWKPLWLEHWTQCKILQQDMGVVIGQFEEIERAGGDLRNLWGTIKTSDRLVIEYRKWLDKYGTDLPFYRGLSTAKSGDNDPFVQKSSWDRKSLHTEICETCTSMVGKIKIVSTGLWLVVGAGVASGIIFAGSATSIASVAAAFVGLIGIVALEAMKSKFEK